MRVNAIFDAIAFTILFSNTCTEQLMIMSMN